MRDDVQEQIRAAAEDLEFAPVEVDPVVADIAKRYPVTDAAIADMKAKFSTLTIAGPEDKKGYALVHDARMTVRELRGMVEKKRKTLKEDSLEYGRKVDAEANRIKGLLLEIETPLDEMETRIDAELERIKQEKQREKDAMVQKRIDALAAVGHPVNLSEIAQMNETVFQMVLKTAQEAFEERERVRKEAEAALAEKQERERLEAERKAQEEARAKAEEAKRLAEERAKLDAQRKEQEAQAAALRAKQDEIERKEREAAQRERDAKIRQEAEARAKADAERRAQEEAARKYREAEEQSKREAAAEAERKAKEAARPDAEKILALVESLRGTAWPKMSTPAGQAVITEAQDAMARYCKFVETKANAITAPVFG